MCVIHKIVLSVYVYIYVYTHLNALVYAVAEDLRV